MHQDSVALKGKNNLCLRGQKIRQDKISKQHINGMYLMHLVCVALYYNNNNNNWDY
jgi:hypothetical protein